MPPGFRGPPSDVAEGPQQDSLKRLFPTLPANNAMNIMLIHRMVLCQLCDAQMCKKKSKLTTQSMKIDFNQFSS
jgi:hypothetical protein